MCFFFSFYMVAPYSFTNYTSCFFLFNVPVTTEIYAYLPTLSLHVALPIWAPPAIAPPIPGSAARGARPLCTSRWASWATLPSTCRLAGPQSWKTPRWRDLSVFPRPAAAGARSGAGLSAWGGWTLLCAAPAAARRRGPGLPRVRAGPPPQGHPDSHILSEGHTPYPKT